MFMSPIYLNNVIRPLRDLYLSIRQPEFNYHELCKNSQNKYHEIVAMCESIVELDKETQNSLKGG